MAQIKVPLLPRQSEFTVASDYVVAVLGGTIISGVLTGGTVRLLPIADLLQDVGSFARSLAIGPILAAPAPASASDGYARQVALGSISMLRI